MAFKQLKQEKKYCVYVDDNFHYQDEAERYADGIFDTAARRSLLAKR